MDTSLMYKIIYYLTLIGVFLPYAVILFGFFSWIIANQTNNLKGKKRATIVVGVAIAVIYLFRAAIANIWHFVQSFTSFFLKVLAGLITGWT